MQHPAAPYRLSHQEVEIYRHSPFAMPPLINLAQMANCFAMKAAAKTEAKIKEHACQACKGTGLPVVVQPMWPGRKIYPVKCKDCGGNGKVTDANCGLYRLPEQD